MGDPNGIGPEVALKALADKRVRRAATYKFVGSKAVLESEAEYLWLSNALEEVNLVEVQWEGDVNAGEITAQGGRAAMECVKTACRMCMDGESDAMVTAPISKEAIQMAGFDFPGHTEYLMESTGADNVVMMMASGSLRVALQTIHIPVSEVASQITEETILANVRTLSTSLRDDFGIENPQVAILGLNPHAGEGGVIGTEEQDTIRPAIGKVQEEGIVLEGPFPADAFFGQKLYEEFDAVLAMYHDQGLAPFKALAMGAGVNVSCGLPIVRTSPDHGTAFDIAGSGSATADSMIEAILLAADIAGRRKTDAR